MLNALNRLWRIIGTGLSFAVMGLGGLVIGAALLAWLALRQPPAEERARIARAWICRAFRLFARFMRGVGVLRWSVEGLEHWRRDTACLVVANHPTLIDVVFLLGLFDGADCVVKPTVLSNPFWGALVRRADYLSNEDLATLLEEASRRLAAGRTLILFPEGTRSVPGQPLAFGALAGAIAVTSGCSCLPVLISCEPPTLYKGLPWYRVPARRVWMRLRILPMLRAPSAPDTALEKRRAARAFSRELEIFFQRELNAATDGPGAYRFAAGALQPVSGDASTTRP